MFGFLAALGPIGIGAAIVGTIATAAYAYAYMNDDDEKSESSSQDTTHHEEKNKIIFFSLQLILGVKIAIF